MPTFTVGEIAERIREPDEALVTVVDRLRNFTKEGLLKPIGSRNPGTGRKRRYPETALIDAAILSKLSVFFDVPAARVLHLDNALKLAGDAASEFEERLRGGHLVFLVVGVVPNLRRPLSRMIESSIEYVENADLKPLDVAGSTWARRWLPVRENFDFGLVINLTSMFKRIGLGGTNG